jgi:maltose alpha-D-glucosyltransferase/alpha-amylase
MEYWHKNAVIYALDVGAYLDSNGDGGGDFTGLTRTLDYLANLARPVCAALLPLAHRCRREGSTALALHNLTDCG